MDRPVIERLTPEEQAQLAEAVSIDTIDDLPPVQSEHRRRFAVGDENSNAHRGVTREGPSRKVAADNPEDGSTVADHILDRLGALEKRQELVAAGIVCLLDYFRIQRAELRGALVTLRDAASRPTPPDTGPTPTDA